VRYQIKQKFFSLTDDFTIKDAHGHDVFAVRGKLLSFRKRTGFYDMQGNELFWMQRRLLAWFATFEVLQGEQVLAVIKRRFAFFGSKFNVEAPGLPDLEISGNFWDHEYQFRRHGRITATVSKQWFSWTDVYGVDVAEEEDDALVLATVVAIDLCMHDGQKD
jgi:uncharacterized protein YxjI